MKNLGAPQAHACPIVKLYEAGLGGWSRLPVVVRLLSYEQGSPVPDEANSLELRSRVSGRLANVYVYEIRNPVWFRVLKSNTSLQDFIPPPC